MHPILPEDLNLVPSTHNQQVIQASLPPAPRMRYPLLTAKVTHINMACTQQTHTQINKIEPGNNNKNAQPSSTAGHEEQKQSKHGTSGFTHKLKLPIFAGREHRAMTSKPTGTSEIMWQLYLSCDQQQTPFL